MNLKYLVIALVAPMILATGCAQLEKVLPDKKVEYKREKAAERDLEVPPDLSSASIRPGSNYGAGPASGSATFSEYSDAERARAAKRSTLDGKVLPELAGVRLMRDGDDRWLVVKGAPDVVWTRVLSFWQENGILLREQDPTVGIMRTTWLENRADIKKDFITDRLKNSFLGGAYDAGTRDQYRVRLERGLKPGTTEVYMTHRGMEEKVNVNTVGESDKTVWVHTGRDVSLEREMLTKLMVHLGVSEELARRQIKRRKDTRRTAVKMVTSDREGAALIIEETFSRAWRVTGLALDRVGFAVEDRNRAEGIYYVRYSDPAQDAKDEGWLSRLKFWGNSDSDIRKDVTYQVKLSAVQQGTRVVVRTEKGEPEPSTTGKRILTLIQEQIR